MNMEIGFEVVFYVGVMLLALIISVAQAASAKRFTFRQGMSFIQAAIYIFVIGYFVITSGMSASFRFWTTALFFVAALGEVAETALLFCQKDKPTPSTEQKAKPSQGQKRNVLDKIKDETERVKRESPVLVKALSVLISLVLTLGISFVSLMIISGYLLQ